MYQHTSTGTTYTQHTTYNIPCPWLEESLHKQWPGMAPGKRERKLVLQKMAKTEKWLNIRWIKSNNIFLNIININSMCGHCCHYGLHFGESSFFAPMFAVRNYGYSFGRSLSHWPGHPLQRSYRESAGRDRMTWPKKELFLTEHSWMWGWRKTNYVLLTCNTHSLYLAIFRGLGCLFISSLLRASSSALRC